MSNSSYNNYAVNNYNIPPQIIEVVFRMFPMEGPRLFEPVLPKIFQEIVDGKV